MTQVTATAPSVLMNCVQQKGQMVCTPVDPKTTTVLQAAIAQDELKIDRGLKATGKGLLVGGTAGLVSGAALAGFLSHVGSGIYGDMLVGGAAVTGAITGGVTGAVAGTFAANFTDNKVVAGAVGGVVGGLATAVVGGGWLPGLITGAIGGVAGSMMVERK